MPLEDDQATAEQAGAEDAFANVGKPPEVPQQGKPEDQKPATETPPAEEAKAPEYVQLTRQELDELKAAAAKTASYDKQFSTVFGTVGRFEKLVKEVQAQQSEATGKLSSAAFDKLKEQFPELADMTKEAVQNALAGKAHQLDKTETAEERAARVQAEMDILQDEHPGWHAIIGAAPPGQADPEHPFRKWLATKSAAYQQRAAASESAAEMSRVIDRYQAETKKSAADTETNKPAKPALDTARADARREQIAAAVTPRGDGARSSSGQITAEDAFLSAGKR